LVIAKTSLEDVTGKLGLQDVFDLASRRPLPASDVLTDKMIHYRCTILLDAATMPETRAEKGLVWKNGFLFLGNNLALDFLNTRPVQDGEPMELLPDFASLLRWFQTAGLLSTRDVAGLKRHWSQSAEARHTMEAMRRLREMLRNAIVKWEDAGTPLYSTIDKLNRLMAAYPMRSRLKKTNDKELLTELYFEPRKPEDLFGPLAHAAAMLFAYTNRDRLRKCDQCVLHFVDTSKKGTRRWCSMQLCGNRLKVAAYAARRRSGSIRTAK
jgi:predicted RNA-binding Zn ribbon-like protein